MNLDYDFWPNGLEAKSSEMGFTSSIYPNPAKDRALLTMELPAPAMVSIELLDMNGRVLQTFPPENYNQGIHSHTLDMNLLPAGIYMCKIAFNAETHVIKVLKSTHF